MAKRKRKQDKLDRQVADQPPRDPPKPWILIITPMGTILKDCHGPDPTRGHARSPGQPAVPRLPTVEVGNRDVSLEAHSIQDLEELADVSMLWDVRDRATAAESRQEADG